MQSRPHLIPALGSAVMLLAAEGNHPYGFYTLLRWVVTLSALVILWVQGRQVIDPSEQEAEYVFAGIALLVFTAVAIVFNPVIPQYLSRQTWAPIDMFTAVAFAAAAFLITSEQKQNAQAAPQGAFEDVPRQSTPPARPPQQRAPASVRVDEGDDRTKVHRVLDRLRGEGLILDWGEGEDVYAVTDVHGSVLHVSKAQALLFASGLRRGANAQGASRQGLTPLAKAPLRQASVPPGVAERVRVREVLAHLYGNGLLRGWREDVDAVFVTDVQGRVLRVPAAQALIFVSGLYRGADAQSLRQRRTQRPARPHGPAGSTSHPGL